MKGKIQLASLSVIFKEGVKEESLCMICGHDEIDVSQGMNTCN